MNRMQIDTAIEREVHRLITEITEHMTDFTQLYVRRNRLELDPAQLEKTLEIVRLALQDGELNRIGAFHERVKKPLDAAFAELDELDATPLLEEAADSPPPPPPAAKGSPKRVTFSV